MTETMLPPGTDLTTQFTQIERVYPADPRLLRAYDLAQHPCFIIADPTEPLYVTRFDSEQEREEWFNEVNSAAQDTLRRKYKDEDDGGAAPIPTVVGRWPRTPAGSAARTILEALAPPRDP